MGERPSFVGVALQQHGRSESPGQGQGMRGAIILVQFPIEPPGGDRTATWGARVGRGGGEGLQDVPASRGALLSHHLALEVGCGQRLGSLRLGADGGAGVGFQPPRRALSAVC